MVRYVSRLLRTKSIRGWQVRRENLGCRGGDGALLRKVRVLDVTVSIGDLGLVIVDVAIPSAYKLPATW